MKICSNLETHGLYPFKIPFNNNLLMWLAYQPIKIWLVK